MYSANLGTLRDRPYTKWEKYMQKRLALKGLVYTRGNLDAYVEKELSWTVLDSGSDTSRNTSTPLHGATFQDASSLQAAITEYTLMDPYGDVTIQDGEGMDRDIPADINISGSDRIGYGSNEYDNQFYTEEYRRKVLIDYKESILNQETTAAPRPNNVFILQDYSANPKVNQVSTS
ncbi:hypothetical protein BC829DRAFT_424194 [Chytridium lagenaria]|nr:hypothetical protein BC829DRAFT_424194 [Chytridium lagenaria]